MFAALLGFLALLGVGARFIMAQERLVLTLPQRVDSRLERHQGIYLPLGRIPLPMQKAIIATEDQSFYTNLGISFEGIARSVTVDLLEGRFVEGGSTITQELARDIFLTPQKSLARKMREVILAFLITRTFSKAKILELYLNEVYFGQGAYGVEAAAKTYFGKEARALSLPQAALLAGLPQAPSSLDPFRDPAAAKRRQEEVLTSMRRVGYLTSREAAQAEQAPLGLVQRHG